MTDFMRDGKQGPLTSLMHPIQVKSTPPREEVR